MKAFICPKEWIFKTYLLLFLMIYLGKFAVVNGQGFVFQHFTEKEGLPSTYLYCILQDEKGFIWMSGESGLLWYDGQNYIVPDVEKELKDEVIAFYGGKDNKVWMQDLSGRVLAFENEKLFNFPEIKPDEVYLYTEVYKHPNGDIWISSLEDVFVYNSEIDSLTPLNVDNTKGNLKTRKAFGQTGDGQTILLGRLGYYLFNNDSSSFFPYKNKTITKDFEFGFQKEGSLYIVLDNQIYFFNLEKEIFEKRLEQFDEYFKVGLLDAFEDSNGDIWFATRDGLLYLHRKENGQLEMSKFLNGYVMGDMIEDKEGNLWFATSQSGVFKLTSKQIKIYNGSKDAIRFVKKNHDGNFIIGFDNNQFKVLDESFNLIEEQKILKENNRLYDLMIDENGNHYFITSRGALIYDKNYKFKKQSTILSLKSGAIGYDGNLWLVGGDAFGYLLEDGSVKFILRKRCYSLLHISKNEFWVGSIEGLFKCNGEECIKIENQKISLDIRDIKKVDNGNLLLVTQKNGLFYYQPQTDSVLNHFSTSNGLSSNNCSKVTFDEKYFWLGTKKGVNRINRSDNKISMIGLDQGLPSNEVNDIFKSEEKIYVATNRGLAYFDESINLERNPPKLQIFNIKINERDTSFQEEYVLDFSNNNIKIEFSTITFNDAENSFFQYKMDGIDKDWIQSNNNIAQYPSLPPGTYTFYLKTKTINSDWSEEQEIKFIIDTPFWMEWWFYLAVVLLIGLISYWIFSEIAKRKNVIKDMKASQLTALRAQMNPHFVFNALNSIQEFIVNKDTRSANKYLSQFSRLMRNILNVSGKNSISLRKEIESLNLYLSLEALRFGDSFEYILDVEEEIDKDSIYIPAMLIQPFVENAVKHGLMHSEGDKKLYLRFYNKTGMLICEVEDNGIGRKKSEEIRLLNPKVYPSKGTGITYERIRLFNSLNRGTLEVKVIDLKNDTGEALGTKIILTIK